MEFQFVFQTSGGVILFGDIQKWKALKFSLLKPFLNPILFRQGIRVNSLPFDFMNQLS